MTIYEPGYYQILKKNQTLTERGIDLVLYAKIDLVYLIVFFGLSIEGQETILSLTSSKYKLDFTSDILDFASLKPKVGSEYFEKWLKITWFAKDKSIDFFKAILLKRRDESLNLHNLNPTWLVYKNTRTFFEPYYPNNYVKYYGGHQFRLGHYFRHIYQSVSFINEQPDLYGDQQYDYVKHLRGQFSTDEQILFFLNSLSQLGRIWELEDKRTGNAILREKQMISDYQLIKNIPNNEVFDGIFLSNFYPKITFEGFEVLQQRTAI